MGVKCVCADSFENKMLKEASITKKAKGVALASKVKSLEKLIYDCTKRDDKTWFSLLSAKGLVTIA